MADKAPKTEAKKAPEPADVNVAQAAAVAAGVVLGEPKTVTELSNGTVVRTF